MTGPLHVGDELHCPHCHRWHPVIRRHEEGTEYTRAMLYWQCRFRDDSEALLGTPPPPAETQGSQKVNPKGRKRRATKKR
jgi:hypothetical protein